MTKLPNSLLCTVNCQGDHSYKATTCLRGPPQLRSGLSYVASSQMTLDTETTCTQRPHFEGTFRCGLTQFLLHMCMLIIKCSYSVHAVYMQCDCRDTAVHVLSLNSELPSSCTIKHRKNLYTYRWCWMVLNIVVGMRRGGGGGRGFLGKN